MSPRIARYLLLEDDDDGDANADADGDGDGYNDGHGDKIGFFCGICAPILTSSEVH